MANAKDKATQYLRTRLAVEVKQKRLAWGITQSELGKEVKVSTFVIGGIEKASNDVSRDLYVKVARYMDIPLRRTFAQKTNSKTKAKKSRYLLFKRLFSKKKK